MEKTIWNTTQKTLFFGMIVSIFTLAMTLFVPASSFSAEYSIEDFVILTDDQTVIKGRATRFSFLGGTGSNGGGYLV